MGEQPEEELVRRRSALSVRDDGTVRISKGAQLGVGIVLSLLSLALTGAIYIGEGLRATLEKMEDNVKQNQKSVQAVETRVIRLENRDALWTRDQQDAYVRGHQTTHETEQGQITNRLDDMIERLARIETKVELAHGRDTLRRPGS